MRLNNPPYKNKKQPRGQFLRTTEKLPDKWPYGTKTKAQWIKAFEEEAKRTNNP
jgi:hypothetical protein